MEGRKRTRGITSEETVSLSDDLGIYELTQQRRVRSALPHFLLMVAKAKAAEQFGAARIAASFR